jgi:hypothetical protein
MPISRSVNETITVWASLAAMGACSTRSGSAACGTRNKAGRKRKGNKACEATRQSEPPHDRVSASILAKN